MGRNRRGSFWAVRRIGAFGLDLESATRKELGRTAGLEIDATVGNSGQRLPVLLALGCTSGPPCLGRLRFGVFWSQCSALFGSNCTNALLGELGHGASSSAAAFGGVGRNRPTDVLRPLWRC